MNKKTTNTILGLIVLVVLGFFIYGLWEILCELLRIVKQINSSVGAAIIAGCFTIIVSTISVLTARYFEKRKAIEADIRIKKIPVYEDFIQKTMSMMLKKDKNKKEEDEKAREDELAKFFQDFTQKIIIWGDEDVIKKWLAFRLHSVNNKPDSGNSIFFIYEDLLLAIRKDIGQSNSKLAKGDMLKLFINDLDDHLSKLQK